MDWLSAGVGAVSDLASTAYANSQARTNMHEQMDWQSKMYGSRYQMQVADLKKADLNPMLAYMSGAPTAGGIGNPQVSKPDTANAINQSRLASAQEANIREDTNNKRAINDQIVADTDLKKSSASMNANLINKIHQEIKNLESENYNIKQQANERGWSAALKSQETELQIKIQAYYDQLTRLTTNEVAISDPKARAAATTGAFAAHGENIKKGLSPLSDLIPTKGYRHKGPKGPNDYK